MKKTFLSFDDVPFEVVWDPEKLFPGLYAGELSLTHMRWKWGNFANDAALVFLCQMVKTRGGNVVEIGTFEGRSTVNMARNMDSGRIYTLDIGASDSDQSHVEGRKYEAYTPGRFFLDAPKPVRERIELIIADSTKYDFGKLAGKGVKLAIVDGGHGLEAVRTDTENCLKVLEPGGVIVWDDYGPRWPDVQDYLNGLAKTLELHYLAREGFVVHVKR